MYLYYKTMTMYLHTHIMSIKAFTNINPCANIAFVLTNFMSNHVVKRYLKNTIFNATNNIHTKLK
jgi:hypothetical protein